MSLVILANTGTHTEQYSKFLKHLDTSIAAYNTALTNSSDKANQNPINQSAFTTRALELLKADNLNGLVEHILTLGDFLIQEPKGIV